MRRQVGRVIVCLVFGAVVTGGGAWGGSLWAPGGGVSEWPPAYASGWVRPAGRPEPKPVNVVRRGWGLDVRTYRTRENHWEPNNGEFVDPPPLESFSEGWEAQVGAAGWPSRCLEWEQ